MLVSGPTGTSVTGSAADSSVAASQSTAWAASGGRLGGGSSAPSRPVSPWMSTATCSSRMRGRSAPTATGTSARPAQSSTRMAFAVVLASVWLPATVVTPRSCTSSLASARSSAAASSWPGSQSMMIGFTARILRAG